MTVIKRMDFFCLAETHVGTDFNIVFDNYTYESCRKISSNNRFYGGLCIFTSNFIRKGIKIIRSNHQDIIWLNYLKKSSLNSIKIFMFVLHIYISPSKSKSTY